jgi:hypothetical protein
MDKKIKIQTVAVEIKFVHVKYCQIEQQGQIPSHGEMLSQKGLRV